MKRKDKVCTIEQAIKLRSLGVLQRSEFFHAVNSYDSRFKEITDSPDSRDDIYSAFDVAELGKMLGRYTDFPVYAYRKRKFKILLNPNGPLSYFNTEAQARAELLIWLIEKKVRAYKIEFVNKRILAE